MCDWSAVLALYCASLAGMGALSLAVRRAGATRRSHWFWLHAAGNAAVCAMAAPAVAQIWRDPARAIYVPRDPRVPYVPPVDGLWIAMLHLYHVACFRDVPWADVLHHALFVPYSQVALLAPGLWGWPVGWGPVVQLQHIFICGLPGLLDYACLALRRDHKMSVAAQKRAQVKLNVWLRVPGVLASCTLLLFETLRYRAEHRATPPRMWPVVLSNCALIGSNALYYAEQVVRAFPPRHACPPSRHAPQE